MLVGQVRHAVSAFGCAGLLALATACGSSPAEEPRAEPSGSGSPSATPSEPTSEPSGAADPEHAVDPPGPFQAPLELADVLLVDPDGELDDGLAERIAAMKGVTEVTSLGIVQVSIENKIYDVAVVDPASYRRFTELRSAQLQEQWDRVAGGELAVDQQLKDRLPIDADGYLRLGPGEDDPVVHVGAYAPQVPTVDLVVNAAWGRSSASPSPTRCSFRPPTARPRRSAGRSSG